MSLYLIIKNVIHTDFIKSYVKKMRQQISSRKHTLYWKAQK